MAAASCHGEVKNVEKYSTTYRKGPEGTHIGIGGDTRMEKSGEYLERAHRNGAIGERSPMPYLKVRRQKDGTCT